MVTDSVQISAVLYSDMVIPENDKVDSRLVDLMRGRGRRIAYIPSGPDPASKFYEGTRKYYARRGLALGLTYNLDEDHSAADREALLAYEAIHLPGGNTAAFLARMRRAGMLKPLAEWARAGGLLIGASAGAILMTPTIAVDALFSGGDPEEVKDGAALGLLPFEFFPHLQANESYLLRLQNYSSSNARPLVACSDGDGVCIQEGIVEFIGDILWLSHGRIEQVKGHMLML